MARAVAAATLTGMLPCPAPEGSSWTRPAPELGHDDAGEPVVCTSLVTRAWFEAGEWWVDFVNTFPGTDRQGYGSAAASTFVARRRAAAG